MKHGTTSYRVSVLLEWPDRVQYRTWTGSSLAGIHKAARAKYKGTGARVSFGNPTWTNSYGAH